MQHLGESIIDAIDWTQDFLKTTRPLAESTLFALLAESKVNETEEGYVLVEAEEEVEKKHNVVKHRQGKKFRFHTKRKTSKQRFTSKMKHLNLDNSTAAEGMMAADDAIDEAESEGLL